jgi:hypothetical protein
MNYVAKVYFLKLITNYCKRLNGVTAQGLNGKESPILSFLPLRLYAITPLCHYAFVPLRLYAITPLYHCAVMPLRRYAITPLCLYAFILSQPSQHTSLSLNLFQQYIILLFVEMEPE